MEPALKKRKREDKSDHSDEPGMKKVWDIGLGAVKSLVFPTSPSPEDTEVANGQEPGKSKDDAQSEEGWAVVTKKKKGKKEKTAGRQPPAITFSKPSALNYQLKLHHLQDLILYILADGKSPQWVAVQNKHGFQKVVVVMVPGLEKEMFTTSMLKARSTSPLPVKEPLPNNYRSSPDHYSPLKLEKGELQEPLHPLADMFPLVWPVRAPGDDRSNRVEDPMSQMLMCPIPGAQDTKKNKATPLPKNDDPKPVPVTSLLATREILVDSEFVMHPAWSNGKQEQEIEEKLRRDQKQSAADGWVDSEVLDVEDADVPQEEIEQGSTTRGRTVYALDCEMCQTSIGELELTRISMIDWGGSTVMDELVKPTNPITDYLTQYSGITEEMLAPVTTTLSDIQERLKQLLHPRAILVGHSINSDLNALKFTHPFIIDTSLLYPHPRGPPLRNSLKHLTRRFLDREIQQGDGATGHDSVEDALATLDLVKMKCERGLSWGTTAVTQESMIARILRANLDTKQKDSSKNGVSSRNRSALVVSDKSVPSRLPTASFSIIRTDDDGVVDGISSATLGDKSGQELKYGVGCDFVWAHLRELETYRGWRDDISSNKDSKIKSLRAAVAATVNRLKKIYDDLPVNTAFIVYSGVNDLHELKRLQQMYRTHREEYRTKKWDDLSVQWTDTEIQASKNASAAARQGIAFIGVKQEAAPQ